MAKATQQKQPEVSVDDVLGTPVAEAPLAPEIKTASVLIKVGTSHEYEVPTDGWTPVADMPEEVRKDEKHVFLSKDETHSRVSTAVWHQGRHFEKGKWVPHAYWVVPNFGNQKVGFEPAFYRMMP